MWNSTLHDTITALHTLWESAPDLAGVWVTDGPPVGNDGASELIAVGYDGNEDSAVLETSSEGFDGDSNREAYTVYCCVSAMTGNDDQDAVRARAFELYGHCCDALALDRTLNDLVLLARPAEVRVRQSATENGRACTVMFGVAVQAYTKES